MQYRFNELYDWLVNNNYIEHIGYNTPYTACGCDDALWKDVNSGKRSESDILLAVARAGRCVVLKEMLP